MSAAPAPSVDSDCSDYIGRSRVDVDFIDLNRARGLHGTLGGGGPEPVIGGELSPLGHWLYFWELRPPHELSADGHAVRGDFLPPLSLARRMWAGSRVQFIKPLLIGSSAWRKATIANIQVKNGNSGRLAIVTVRYEVGTENTLCILDEQDIIYREPSPIRVDAKPATGERPPNAIIDRVVKVDAVTLFRYSALTFNGHRIHYDRGYAMHEEQYPGLVVHGPLLATLMVCAAGEAGSISPIQSFNFKAGSPIFDIDEFRVVAHRSSTSMNVVDTCIINPRGQVAFSGAASFE